MTSRPWTPRKGKSRAMASTVVEAETKGTVVVAAKSADRSTLKGGSAWVERVAASLALENNWSRFPEDSEESTDPHLRAD